MTGSVPLVEVENLRVSFEQGGRRVSVVRGVSFTVEAGESLAIVGESGSGKSVTARTLVGLTGRGAVVEATTLELRGEPLRELTSREWRRIRGSQVGLVLQDALVSLDPLRRSGAEVEEVLRAHRQGSRADRRRRVLEVMASVGIPEPEIRARQRSGELSGGLRQRALIAAAIALDPPLLIADEPTTALDTTVQAQVIDLLNVARQRGRSLLLISHDLAVVSKLADRILVMRGGEMVEFGTAEQVLGDPQDPYTRSLIAAVPSLRTRGARLSSVVPRVPEGTSVERRLPMSAAGPILSMRGISRSFRVPGGGRKQAVDDVSLEIAAGETLGIVGESGSGKTTVSRIALGLLEPDTGTVLLQGRPWSGIGEGQRRPLRRRMSVVYQDPLSSFDPRWRVRDILSDALHGEGLASADRDRRMLELLSWVGLEPEYLDRNPRTFSGGQRQRVSIARAIAPKPDLIVLDEAVSALDASIQAQVLDLFAFLQRELGVSYLFISHDLGVIGHMSDRILVMKDGRVVEQGTPDQIFGAPQHAYTRLLVSAVRVDFGATPPPVATPGANDQFPETPPREDTPREAPPREKETA